MLLSLINLYFGYVILRGSLLCYIHAYPIYIQRNDRESGCLFQVNHYERRIRTLENELHESKDQRRKALEEVDKDQIHGIAIYMY